MKKANQKASGKSVKQTYKKNRKKKEQHCNNNENWRQIFVLWCPLYLALNPLSAQYISDNSMNSMLRRIPLESACRLFIVDVDSSLTRWINMAFG